MSSAGRFQTGGAIACLLPESGAKLDFVFAFSAQKSYFQIAVKLAFAFKIQARAADSAGKSCVIF